jgi:hypothetical protein
MTSWSRVLQGILQVGGRIIALLWLQLVGIIIILGFPISGIAGSLLVGYSVFTIFGGGGFTVLGVAFLVGLFLSIYVWTPHVGPAVRRAADALMEGF